MAVILELRALPEGGARMTGEEPAEVLQLASGRDEPVPGPVRYELHAQLVSHELIVRGSLESNVSFECSRCGATFARQIREPGFCLSKEVPNKFESVDLTEEIRESIILAFPTNPVCRDDCKGLCLRCGANQNEVPCQCEPPTEHGWAAFDGLKLGQREQHGGTKKKKVKKSDPDAETRA